MTGARYSCDNLAIRAHGQFQLLSRWQFGILSTDVVLEGIYSWFRGLETFITRVIAMQLLVIWYTGTQEYGIEVEEKLQIVFRMYFTVD